jgi:hypothetical protein
VNSSTICSADVEVSENVVDKDVDTGMVKTTKADMVMEEIIL